jgi:hypothetical protein
VQHLGKHIRMPVKGETDPSTRNSNLKVPLDPQDFRYNANVSDANPIDFCVGCDLRFIVAMLKSQKVQNSVYI